MSLIYLGASILVVREFNETDGNETIDCRFAITNEKYKEKSINILENIGPPGLRDLP